MKLNRRQFILSLAATVTTTAWYNFPEIALADNSTVETFSLPPLAYAYDALEPYIDAETMKFHHDKHHAAYTKNLNAAISKYPDLQNQSAEELLKQINKIPRDIRQIVRNNGGGYVNHKMFWEIMTPQGEGKPTGKIGEEIERAFGSFEAFQEKFEQAGNSRFGSGWVWLVLDKSHQLKVISTANQDNPFMENMYPIMGNDIWEHAYYLKYRNNRGEYLKNWWKVVNWQEIDRRFSIGIAIAKAVKTTLIF